MALGDPPRGLPSRRRLLAAAVLAPWMLGAAPATAGCAHQQAAAATPVRTLGPPPAVHTRWDAHASGPLPAVGDEGRPVRAVALGGVPPTISGGALVGNLPAAPSATYLEQDLQVGIARIGATFGFGAGAAAQGSVGLITWVAAGALTGPVHVAISPDRWTIASVHDAALTEFASRRFSPPLPQDGRPLRAEARVDGDTVALTLPDGTVVSGRNPAVAALTGTVACWEFYREAADGCPVRVFETWAS